MKILLTGSYSWLWKSFGVKQSKHSGKCLFSFHYIKTLNLYFVVLFVHKIVKISILVHLMQHIILVSCVTLELFSSALVN